MTRGRGGRLYVCRMKDRCGKLCLRLRDRFLCAIQKIVNAERCGNGHRDQQPEKRYLPQEQKSPFGHSLQKDAAQKCDDADQNCALQHGFQ